MISDGTGTTEGPLSWPELVAELEQIRLVLDATAPQPRAVVVTPAEFAELKRLTARLDDELTRQGIDIAARAALPPWLTGIPVRVELDPQLGPGEIRLSSLGGRS